MRAFLFHSVISLAFIALPSLATAQVMTIDDTATFGVLPPPMMASPGAGTGFGSMIGRPVTIAIDSDITGAFTVGMRGGACMGQDLTHHDVAVLYIDSVPGGFASTMPLTDTSTPEAAAVSGLASSGAAAPLVFPMGFQANFAIAFTNPDPSAVGGATPTALLFPLTTGTMTPVPLTPTQVMGCAGFRIDGLTMPMLGLAAGDSFDWVGTLINAFGAFRSNEFHGNPAPAANIGAMPYAMTPVLNRFISVGPIVINEVDSDTPGTDGAEFIELLGPPNIRMDGLVLVAFNGSDDRSYLLRPPAVDPGGLDLDGTTLSPSGFLVAGNAAAPNVDALLIWPNNSLQNGADGVGLYLADGTDFPNDTPVHALGLVDAVVYDTNDGDDVGLISVLTPGEAQLNEGGNGHKDTESNGRCPDGAGGARMTGAYIQSTATPGAPNLCDTCGDGTLDAGEQCDDGADNGSAGSCCLMDCSFRPSGEVCAASAGDCDADDTCDGAGTCDVHVAGTDTVCRAAVAGGCDIAENCDGSSPTCPADVVEPVDTVCRPATTNGCDLAEVCDGSANTCPADGFAAPGTVCRPAMGDCDVAETCGGTTDTCPVDSFAAAGTVCHASTGVCDPAETCPGTSNACPSDAFLADGTSCADSTVCDGAEMCMAGACVAGAALDCDDSDMCTADSCAEPGGCAHSAIAGCCNVDADCSDGDVCTADTCSGPGGTCSFSAITGCCEADAECDDSNMCTTDSCDLASNRCETTPVPGCCAVASDCDDSNACTTDSCDAASGTCSNTEVAGCCLTAGDCDDSDTCTMDVCNASMTCENPALAGCCTADSDCDDSDPCTTDACDAGAAVCTFTPIAGCGVDGGVGADGGGVADDASVGGDGGIAPADAGFVLDAGPAGDGGSADGGVFDGGPFTDGGPGGTSGGACGCRVGGAEHPSALWLLGLGALLLRRRRRRQR